MSGRLYLIGMDSTPLWILRDFRKEKGMEAFDLLLKKNLICDMESTLPPMTGPAWPTIYTGLTPGEHGVPDFFVMKDNYTPDIVYYDSTVTAPFWRDLTESGKRCLVITPATDIRLPGYLGIDLITGFPLKSRGSNAEMNRLMKKHSFYGEPDIEKDMKAGKMSDEDGAKVFAGTVKRRIKLAEEAMEKKDYDFVFVCFTETDRLQHFTMNKPDRKRYLLPLYSEISQFIGRLMKKADRDGDAVMIVSDHGMQPIYSKFLVNCWLYRNKYVALKENIAQGIESAGDSNAGNESVRYKIREKLMRSQLRKAYDRLPHEAKSAVFTTLGSFFAQKGAGSVTRVHLFDFEMHRTKLFAAISNDPVSTIWINDSRFKDGFVGKAEKSRLKKEIMKRLLSVKAADGSQLIVNVFDGKDYYRDTDKFIAPDVLFEAKHGYTVDIANFSKDSIFMEPEPPKRGDHERNGIFGFYSADAKHPRRKVSVLNVAPTVLEYYRLRNAHSKNSILRELV